MTSLLSLEILVRTKGGSIEGSTTVGEAPDPRRAAQEAASVHKAASDEHERIIKALARAFFGDPVMSWAFPNDSRRMEQLERFFAYLGEKVWFPQAESYTTANVAAAALWERPNEWKVGLIDQIRMMPGLASATGWRDLSRTIRGLGRMDAKHPEDPHYYLPIIGVDPPWQGKGLGTAVLRPMLERCDAEGMPAYLEATSPRNRSCFERNGFKLTEEITLPKGPTFFGMWREPATRDS